MLTVLVLLAVPAANTLPDGATARVGSPILRHPGLADLVVLPNGTVITAGPDSVRTHDPAVREPATIVPLEGDSAGRILIALSPDAKYVAGWHKRSLRVYDTGTGKEIASLVSPDNVLRAIRFTPDNSELVIVGGDEAVTLVDWRTGKQRTLGRANRRPRDDTEPAVCFSPDGSLFALGGMRDTATVTDTATGRERWGVVAEVSSFAFSSDSKRLAVAVRGNGTDPTVLLFDAGTGKAAGQWQAKEAGTLRELAFSPDGTRLAGSTPAGVRVFDAQTGRTMVEMSAAGRVRFAPNGKSVVVADGSLVIVADAATGRDPLGPQPNFDPRSRAVLSPDAKWVATADRGNPAVHVWDTVTGKHAREWPASRDTVALTFSPDGRWLSAGGEAGAWERREVATGKLAGLGPALAKSGAFVLGRAFAADGRVAALEVRVEAPRRAALVIRDAAGEPLLRHDLRVPEPRSCVWSPDLAVAVVPWGPNRVSILDPATRAERFTADGNAETATFSPDGRLLAVPSLNEIAVIEVLTGKQVASVPLIAELVALADDGRTLAAVVGRTLHVRDLATGTGRELTLPTDRFEGKHAFTLALSADGRRAFTGVADGTGLVWDTSTKREPAKKADLVACWADLASDDAGKAWAALRTLDADRGEAVAFLVERLTPAEPDADALTGLLRDLDAPTAKVRDTAARRLAALGHAAAPALRAALAGTPSPEARRRLTELLDRHPTADEAADAIRRARALRVSEWANTPASRAAIRRLADGLPHFPDTRAARAASLP